jgi:hypothetical protein
LAGSAGTILGGADGSVGTGVKAGDTREPCCLATGANKGRGSKGGCGTRWEALRTWTCAQTGKGVRVVQLNGEAQGKAPFFAQPVGFDGKSFHVAFDHGCDTEKLLHEVCHWLVAPRARRVKPNYGLGPGPGQRIVDDEEGDNEEVTVMLLERLLAPHFALPEERIARPDYNVADRRNIDWELCEERATRIYDGLRGTLP